MTLRGALETWIAEAERMGAGAATLVVVSPTLHRCLDEELGPDAWPPTVAGLDVVAAAERHDQADRDLPLFGEVGDIEGADRISVYVGEPSPGRRYPLGHDPAMPVFFVSIPPAELRSRGEIEMYNRLRWAGLGPEEAFAGAQALPD